MVDSKQNINPQYFQISIHMELHKHFFTSRYSTQPPTYVRLSSLYLIILCINLLKQNVTQFICLIRSTFINEYSAQSKQHKGHFENRLPAYNYAEFQIIS